MRELHTCMALGNCGGESEKSRVIGSNIGSKRPFVRGWRGGEGVWYVNDIIQCTGHQLLC